VCCAVLRAAKKNTASKVSPLTLDNSLCVGCVCVCEREREREERERRERENITNLHQNKKITDTFLIA